jgi:NIPSNAP
MTQAAPNQIWQKHGIDAIGFWTTFIGVSSDEFTYILQESLADFEASWTALLSYPVWHKVRDESERDGAIIASISNQIPAPTAFSALK